MYRPKNRNELMGLILNCYRGKLYLKDIDTSLIDSMSYIFDSQYYQYKYREDDMDINIIWDNPNNVISDWDTSNVTDINSVFYGSKFNQDISNWNTSNVTDMRNMFYGSKFNQDISMWDISSVTDMSWMFAHSEFNQDISEWILSLNPGVNMGWFNENSKHREIYGGIYDYRDFLKSINWKVLLENSDIKKRYKLLKKLNNIKSIDGVDLDIRK